MKVLRQSEISCLWLINLYTQKKSCLEKYYCFCVERIQPQLAGMSIWQKLLIMAIVEAKGGSSLPIMYYEFRAQKCISTP